MKTLQELQTELRYTVEGLEQMQQPDAGYFEDLNNKQYAEILRFDRDVRSQTQAIDSLEKRIANLTSYQTQYIN